MQVKIIINSVDDGEKSQVITYGEKKIENGDNIVTYDEQAVSGMEGTTSSLVYNEERLKICRDGVVKSEMVICSNGEDEFTIDTEYGYFSAKIEVEHYDFKSEVGYDKCEMKYELSVSGEKVSNHEIQICVYEIGE